jgi:hypothetical protein
VPVFSTKFIFTINSYVKIKNLTVFLEKGNRHQAQLKEPEQQVQYRDREPRNDVDGLGRRRIEIEGLLFSICIKFSKIKIGHTVKAIESPIDSGNKKVEIRNNILFLSHQIV